MTTAIGSLPDSPCPGPLTPVQLRKKSDGSTRKGDIDLSPHNSARHISTIPLLLFLVILSLSASLVLGQTPGASDITQLDDRVHYGDLVDVDVLGGFEFDWRGTVTPEGTLDGLETFDSPVFALCRTEKEIASDIAKIYSRILRDPKVIVKIIDRSNRALVQVDGAVRTPTRFSIRRQVTLRELIVLAGGIVTGASGEITVFRPSNLSCERESVLAGPGQDNRSQTTTIKISDILSGKVAANPVILSGDIVSVSRASPVFVIGAVNRPGSVYLTPGMTLSRMIAAVGGLGREADGSTITIFRRSIGETVNLEFDLAKIERGELEDEVLRSFDIIDVPAKGGSKRRYPPASPIKSGRDINWGQMPLKIVD